MLLETEESSDIQPCIHATGTVDHSVSLAFALYGLGIGAWHFSFRFKLCLVRIYLWERLTKMSTSKQTLEFFLSEHYGFR